jgi:flagellar biosynthesis component FlhA
MIIEELTQTVSIVENGKRRTIHKIRAAVRQALNRAIMCDFKALQQVFNMLRALDALKRVATTNTKRTIPMIHEGLSASEAAKLYQQTLADTDADGWDD